jgi:glycosyltransferase involved in cell wall biosynthesis
MSIAYTVAMCTHNHMDRLARTLTELALLKPPTSPWELIVVDNASSDGTATLLAQHNWPDNWHVRIVREERLGLSNARNRALEEAAGEYILFFDDDETLDPEWLLAYEREITAHRPDALGGRIDVMFEGGERPSWVTDELLGFLGKLDYGPHTKWLSEPQTPFYGGNFACRMDLFDEVGRFDVQLGRKGRDNTGGEDTVFYRQLVEAGKQVRWVPQAVIHHRIEAGKLRKSYFLDLHFRQGRMEGSRKRGHGPRVPPTYLYGQLARAFKTAILTRRHEGSDNSLRKEMNLVYFIGYIWGWAFGPK